ncbi:hypothetical protein E2C01_025715 [Portunus trituberculatus]|uniref:Uncharacterized protein n=1 Tax=Portunus trituberculatus TaxID=210409 RepID=A0A5B7EGV6_PORTR|nr:hypothetical protein [Portunus trituberculatus]
MARSNYMLTFLAKHRCCHGMSLHQPRFPVKNRTEGCPDAVTPCAYVGESRGGEAWQSVTWRGMTVGECYAFLTHACPGEWAWARVSLWSDGKLDDIWLHGADSAMAGNW